MLGTQNKAFKMNFEGPLSIEIYVKHKEHMAKKAFLSMGYSF
jgi:hypothetical protein